MDGKSLARESDEAESFPENICEKHYPDVGTGGPPRRRPRVGMVW